MGVAVNFDYQQWINLFPEFSTTVSGNQATGILLPLATRYHRNDGYGPVNNPDTQLACLNLMMAHVAALLFGSSINPVSPLVGRITDATEGSVSVSTEFPMTASNAWYEQTKYGSMYWQMILPFRLGNYVPKVTPLQQPYYQVPWLR